MPGLYSITTRVAGETLTAAKYNSDNQNHVDNQTPQMTDDYSSNVAQMQTTTDPGEVGTESQPTSLAGELERIRFKLLELSQQFNPDHVQWYQSPPYRSRNIVLAGEVFS